MSTPALTRPDWASHWPDEAVEFANGLARGGYTHGRAQGHIPIDAPLPESLRSLAGARAGFPDTGFPHWATLLGPVDWPTLLDSPDLVIEEDELADNEGATWASIMEAFRYLTMLGRPVAIEAILSTDAQSRVAVFPIAITVPACEPHEYAVVAEILERGGRDRATLGTKDNEWHVSC